ncbi:MAG: HemK2/MTQ2 family protein methyltransferase [Candidatus Woesearchaeota archaeon]
MVYEPREDSFLLKKHIKEYAYGLVLDMGTGSGIQAQEAAKSKKVKKVYAVDIDPEAIRYCKSDLKSKKIVWKRSDLFSIFQKQKTKPKFDFIIFNPPYLPEDARLKDQNLDGGKKGYELTIEFLNQSKTFLQKDGKILLLFSSLTNKKIIDNTIRKLNLKSERIDSEKHFYEELYVYLIRK